MTSHRVTRTEDGTPIQQSLTVRPADYRVQSMDRLMLGVVLSVYPADSVDNRTAQQREDRRGFAHECDVLVLNDGSSGYLTLKNVVITPDSVSGIDNYYEHLPRGSSCLTTGETYNQLLQRIDPYDLDGDFCVVGFVGGLLDSPFILRWWPHARNPFDPATSGQGLEGNTLVQERRYFHRINGVEHTVSSKGDVVVSTTFANSTLSTGQDPALGRFARTLNPDVGGSIRVYLKPSQSFELDFNEQIDGIGVRDSDDQELPQTNPKETDSQPSNDLSSTRVSVDQEYFVSRVPVDHTFVCGERFTVETGTSAEFTVGEECLIRVEGETLLEGTGTIDIISSDVVTLDGTQILLGADAASPEAVIKGDSLRQWFTTTFTVDSPFGPLPATLAGVNLLLAEAGSTKSFVE